MTYIRSRTNTGTGYEHKDLYQTDLPTFKDSEEDVVSLFKSVNANVYMTWGIGEHFQKLVMKWVITSLPFLTGIDIIREQENDSGGKGEHAERLKRGEIPSIIRWTDGQQ